MLIGKKPIGTMAYLGGLPAILEPFCWSWGQAIMHSQEALCGEREYIHLDRATMSDHGPARNSLANRFLGDWLFMTDADHTFEPDVVVRLLDRMKRFDLDVITGFYQFKTPPYSPVLFSWAEDEKGTYPIGDWSFDTGVLEVGSAGGGCVLIKRSAFDKIGYELSEAPFDKISPFSEDHSFFLRCKRVGIKLWCDMRIHSRHLRIHEVVPEDYDKRSVMLSDHIPAAGIS